ncbi:Uncharacterised protein [uncultured archaeon]|nr:Uncharacterised protein [uncultured archaeon]
MIRTKKSGRIYWIILIGVIFFILIGLFVFFRSNEDTWTLDSQGVYVKHGNPAVIPAKVLEQQEALFCADNKYRIAQDDRLEFNSQCLGRCGNYSVDIVHVPRTADDDLSQNQCEDYKNQVTSHFIELNNKGIIVRVV